MTCEGFSNYATFGVAVTLDNDRQHNERVRENYARIVAAAPNHAAVKDGTWTVEQATEFELADFLKDYAERACETAASGLASQMVQAGLSEVDWRELANYYIAVES